uniref:Uncharacterized protein n=1 Tax=Arundo donax TaxID=35708 RepID=A0A0A9AGP9_ARUDO
MRTVSFQQYDQAHLMARIHNRSSKTT